jgi:hypothetical protein
VNKSLISRKLFSVQHRINKRIYGKQLNLPYLSGDGFESICDFSAYSRGVNLVSNTDISSAKSIFCTSQNVEKFIQEFGSRINANILVLGNSDRDFYEFDLQLPSSIKYVYLQNSHVSDNFFRTLPIGIENLRYARNGIPSLFSPKYYLRAKKNKVIAGPFSPTNDERNEIFDWKRIKHNSLDYFEGHISPTKFADITSRYLYVACPRGNGTDTHRFWETLYRGSIPVVKRSKWSDSIQNLKIPFIQLSSWDFEEFMEATDKQPYSAINPEELPVLWTDYWEKLFEL